ncbi:fumarate hydratase [Apilactobacillus kunkeei]|uniref:class II fumarate hydratase n=1 Tax=Apilactobacillus kunkeei TaxID=148814 RepID=UPI00059B4135|nr:class II fumarate hydratase [Apilactobacillus kunkeei]KIM18175.1 fumarate hydratase [Apilactobacillus kunkeei]
MMEFRIEHDSLGEVKVPKDALFGPQTQRSLHNFNIGRTMPMEVIYALLKIKKAVAFVNHKNHTLDDEKYIAINKAINKLIDGDYKDAFPLHVYQTGSGTQTNMNVNEVVANMANKLHPNAHVHPNDHVNQSQSSNDTFPTAMMMAAYQATNSVIKTVENLIASFDKKQTEFASIIKIGRTHLQDATPITVGQEISGWTSTLEHDVMTLNAIKQSLLELPIGGTAVGTGLNTKNGFDQDVVDTINNNENTNYKVAENKFHGLADHSEITSVHGIFKTLASDLIKIGNDIRFLSSGPRAGYNELSIPSNEPGSSIMPGKVNPTQIEALTMVSAKVFGNDATITFANSQGNFEMNVYKPIIIDSFLESTELLNESINSFTEKLVDGLTVNVDHIKELLNNSLMLVTALSPHIGYEKSAKIAQWAEKNNTTLKESAKHFNIDEADFKKWVNVSKMTHPNK